jgi:hypothetical protein
MMTRRSSTSAISPTRVRLGGGAYQMNGRRQLIVRLLAAGP